MWLKRRGSGGSGEKRRQRSKEQERDMEGEGKEEKVVQEREVIKKKEAREIEKRTSKRSERDKN